MTQTQGHDVAGDAPAVVEPLSPLTLLEAGGGHCSGGVCHFPPPKTAGADAATS